MKPICKITHCSFRLSGAIIKKFHTAPAGGAGDLGPPNEIPLTRLAETTVGADYRKSFFQKDIPSVHIFCAKKSKEIKLLTQPSLTNRNKENDS